ncbi:amidohydrolase family protein [Marinicella rhabdoformis]|uniref:amidohydrolase family protein n=1 Tax=Marinicella rhabdoformis TaxID=2580566 RepID=UPI0015D05199|nr:amidohydrolase family protein [Marinicella rhabdoformis]
MKIIKKISLWILSILILLVLLAVYFYLMPLKKPEVKPYEGDLFIADIHVVDVIHERINKNQNVVITGGIIEHIDATVKPEDFSSHRLIDGSEKYLMPGLWDMHTHSLKISPYLHHPLFIRYGVTAARDMSGCLEQDDSYWACPDDRRRWTQMADQGDSVSPAFYQQSSYQTNGGNEVPTNFADFFHLKSYDHAEQMARFYAQQGVDFIKTYSELSADQFRWLVQAVAEQGIQLAGHKPLEISLEQALESQMASIEHGRLFAFECYKDIESFRSLSDPISAYNAEKIRDIINNQDPGKCTQLMQNMGSSQTAWVPTLTTLNMSAQSRGVDFDHQVHMQYIPTVVKTLIWQPDVKRASKGLDKEGGFVHNDYYELAKTQIKKAHENKVKILVGTDNIDTMVFSGFSVHQEMQNLVDAGLPAAKSLQAATLWPAQFSGVDGVTGSVNVGKRADLVILNNNPLANIRHTQAIEAVLFNGLYYDDDALAALEKYTINMADSIQLNTKLLLQMLMSPLMRVQMAD